MQEFSMGAGIASLAFWLFIAAIVVAGIWYDIRRKEAQQKTIRTIVERGEHLDEKIIESILAEKGSDPKETSSDLKVASIITYSASAGLAVLGIILGMHKESALYALLGVSGLVLCIATGLWFAAKVKYQE